MQAIFRNERKFLMKTNNLFDSQKYPELYNSTRPVRYNPYPLLGGEDTLNTILATLHKDEMSNILLLAYAGGGKSATVQEFAKKYADQYIVLETSIAQLLHGGSDYLARNFKELFYEIEQYRKKEHEKRELVLFIDEFHQLPLASKAAVEDLKPEFARSAELGIHIIGATTYDEYHEYVEGNDALRQRFQLCNLPAVNDDLAFRILKSRMRRQHDVKQTPETDRILKEIIYYTDTYIKSRVQPRKSTDILDEMIGWVRIGRQFNHKLFAHVFFVDTNFRIDLQRDAKGLKDYLNNRVFNQPLAVNAIVGNAYSAILGVTDDHKPRGVFLFVGSTGVGKTELAKAFSTGMFGPDASPTIFDMAEYSSPDTVDVFKNNLTDCALTARTPVILLDEIEKSNPAISNLLFSVFDEARLSDRNGREVTFSNFFFILTTNAGQEIFDDIGGNGYNDQQITEALENYNTMVFRRLSQVKSFPTPLLGRLTGFVPFAPMSHETNVKIAKRTFREMARLFMEKQNVKVRYDYDNLLRFVTQEKLRSSAEAGGARQVKTIIRRNVINVISQYLVFHPEVNDLYVTTTGTAASTDKKVIKGTEHAIVCPTAKSTIINDFKIAQEKYKTPVLQTLKHYQTEGLKIGMDIKGVFRALSMYDLDDDAEDVTTKFFLPLERYAVECRDWERINANGIHDPDHPRPSHKINLKVYNNELVVEQV